MLADSPVIRMNRYRVTAHHIAFFIFIVANVGGCLTPIVSASIFCDYAKVCRLQWSQKNGGSRWASDSRRHWPR